MSKQTTRSERTLWILTTILVLIGVAIVVRRLLFLNDLHKAGGYVPGTKSRSPVPDTGFAEHPLLTLIHIIPGLVFMLLAPLQFVKRIRLAYPLFIRVSWYVVFGCGIIIGGTALIMGFTIAIGGIVETLAVAVYGVLFLFSLLKAFIYLNVDAACIANG
ncbi:MAG TPA: hypothetical protein VG367_16510 [Mucilaginibacter sp.]|jgi:hypothetical protein|nr:hypothetical protein [Mucilaginibacter sp.]